MANYALDQMTIETGSSELIGGFVPDPDSRGPAGAGAVVLAGEVRARGGPRPAPDPRLV